MPLPSPEPQPIRTPEAAAEDVRAIALHGDRQAFERLFRYFAPRLKSFFLRQGVSADLADELAQEAMIALWRKAGSFDPAKASVATWLFTIARNKRIDRARRDARPDLTREDYHLLVSAPTPADQAANSASDADMVGRSLAQLTQDQRMILGKAYFEDKSHSTIAQELGLPLGTVKSRIRLALIRLRLLAAE